MVPPVVTTSRSSIVGFRAIGGREVYGRAQRGLEKRERRPGMLAENTMSSDSAIAAIAWIRSGGRVHATMTPCENHSRATTPAQNAVRAPPCRSNDKAKANGGTAKMATATHSARWPNQIAYKAASASNDAT